MGLHVAPPIETKATYGNGNTTRAADGRAMPTPSSGRDSRRGSKANAVQAAGDSGSAGTDRREKAKSGQYPAGARRSSLKPEELNGRGGSAPRRPGMSRGNSAPIIERSRGTGYATGVQEQDEEEQGDNAQQGDAGAGAAASGQDEDEVAGVVGAVKQYAPFQNPELEEPLPEINIAVTGGDGVGKSTLIQRALDLPFPAPSLAAERKIPYEGTVYLIRLLEIPIDDVDIDDDDTVSWPGTIADKMMPRIDGVLTLYDVKDRGSLEGVPETLAAIQRAATPSVLVSCKCDTHPAERQVDPTGIELKARQAVKTLQTLQASVAHPETYKRGLAMLVKSVVHGEAAQQARDASANRRRAQSNALRPISPRPPSLVGHARASSEHSMLSQYKDKMHSRHDSSLAGYSGGDRLKVPHEQESELQNSFLFEESGTEASQSPKSSIEVDLPTPPIIPAQPTAALAENGASFEDLVDRLLAQPTSKQDGKFVVIFLALYRKFAAPGRLLEAIAERFDTLERNGTVNMIKMVAQLRCLSIMEQWISHYPGDFAFQKTRRRMRTFIAKISAVSIFNVAAKEMTAGLEAVQEDDDTNWAYSDKNREATNSDTYRWTMSSTASTLIDDESFIYPDNMSIMTTGDDVSVAATHGADTVRSVSSSTTSSQLMQNVESAQRQAQLLQPRNRLILSKMEWRMLMEIPDDLIAKELTREDWIMFSSIRPRDLVRQVSLKAAEQAKCKNLVNVNRMIEHFNHLAAWVQNFILLRDKPKHRALMLEKMMKIARKVRELNNYNALGAFIAGIKSTAVYRLEATRNLIPPPVSKDWMKLEILMSHSRSYSAYRLAWENSSAERIPYIPLHRRDLVSAEEGNKTFIGDEKNARINWKKFEVMGEVIVGLQRAQGLPYRGLGTGRGGEQVRELLLDMKLVKDEDVRPLHASHCSNTS